MNRSHPNAERRLRRPWYAGGLCFECQPQCGACCTRHDEYGYVYLEPEDVARLAVALGLDGREFRNRWTRREDGYTVLTMGASACPFLDGTRCGVYDARPAQCRTFPFWRENLVSASRWSSLAAFCPGIGRGEPLPLAVIRDRTAGRPAEDV